jgi:hypothetical protein
VRAATHEKHVQEPVPVDVSNPRVDVSNLRAPMFPALRRKTTDKILILKFCRRPGTVFPLSRLIFPLPVSAAAFPPESDLGSSFHIRAALYHRLHHPVTSQHRQARTTQVSPLPKR